MIILFFACIPTKTNSSSSPKLNHSTHPSPHPHFSVKGRQGIAAIDDQYYVSGSTSLHTYDTNGTHILSNEDPFQTYTTPANHIGDIEAHNGELYIAAEWFEDGAGKDIQIAIHDAKTLEWKLFFICTRIGTAGSQWYHHRCSAKDCLAMLVGGG